MNDLIKTDPAPGYGLRVGGPRPYVAGVFVSSIGNPSAQAIVQKECTEDYHDAVSVVVLTLADYRRLLKAAKGRTT